MLTKKTKKPNKQSSFSPSRGPHVTPLSLTPIFEIETHALSLSLSLSFSSHFDLHDHGPTKSTRDHHQRDIKNKSVD